MPGFPRDGRPLRRLGLPSHVRKIDAAFVGLGTTNKRTYIVSDHAYWSVKDNGVTTPSVDYGYPRDMALLRGVPVPVDAAFTDDNGKSFLAFSPINKKKVIDT